MSQFEYAASGIRIRIGNFQSHPPTSEHSPIYSDPSWENLMIKFISHRNRMIQSFLLWFTHGCYLSALRQLLSCFTMHCFKQCHFTGFMSISGCLVNTNSVLVTHMSNYTFVASSQPIQPLSHAEYPAGGSQVHNQMDAVSSVTSPTNRLDNYPAKRKGE